MKLILIILIVSAIARSQDYAQGEMLYKLPEKELIKRLQHADMHVRNESAHEIKRRIRENETVIAPGNIFEHGRAYWTIKTSKFKEWRNYEELEQEFGFDSKKRYPPNGKIKVYRLDNTFIIYVQHKRNQKKAKIYSIGYAPISFRVEPPDRFTGIWRTYNITGSVRIETNYIDGAKNGEDVIYYANGNICWLKLYDMGKIMEMRGYTMT